MSRAARYALVAGVVALLATACGTGAPTGVLDVRSGETAATSATKTGAGPAAGAPVAKAAFTCPSSAGSAGSARPPLEQGRKLQVATTVAPLTSIVSSVAGDRADVRGVIPEGTDSHTFEPKPSVASLFSKADIVFVNGLSLEDRTLELARKNLPDGGQVIELGDHVLPPEGYIYDFSFPREGGKPNPHLWTNLPMAKCYAVVAAAALGKADPANADHYRANATRLGARIDELDRRFRRASDAMPAPTRALLTYHDAWAYFAAHYGWKVIGAIQVSSFEDPTPKEVAALIQQVRREKVPAIFGSEVFPSPVLAQIGRDAGVKYVDQLRDDDLPGDPADAGHSYLGLMKADFVTMVSSLGGDASDLAAFDTSDPVKDSATYPQ